MDIIRKTKRLVGKNLAKTVIILAVLVAAIGAVGMAMPGGGVLGKLPDASMKTPWKIRSQEEWETKRCRQDR